MKKILLLSLLSFNLFASEYTPRKHRADSALGKSYYHQLTDPRPMNRAKRIKMYYKTYISDSEGTYSVRTGGYLLDCSFYFQWTSLPLPTGLTLDQAVDAGSKEILESEDPQAFVNTYAPTHAAAMKLLGYVPWEGCAGYVAP